TALNAGDLPCADRQRIVLAAARDGSVEVRAAAGVLDRQRARALRHIDSSIWRDGRARRRGADVRHLDLFAGLVERRAWIQRLQQCRTAMEPLAEQLERRRVVQR